ncbi:MAG TPA: hypothetical protein VLS96_21815 [Nodosilinea sp.]|nr:hypothetical protein [Nodosilinea sp.]
MSKGNEGINISGGSINASQIVVGRDARSTQTTYNITGQQHAIANEVAAAIADLLAAVEDHSDKISNKEEAVQVIQRVAEESQKENPDKFTLKGLLSALKESLGSVVEIGEKGNLLQKVIAAMMGLPYL